MRKLKFDEDQIVSVLRQHRQGVSVLETCRCSGITRQTYYRWRNQYGELSPAEIRRVRRLEDENRKLRRLLVLMAPPAELPAWAAPGPRRDALQA